LTSKIHLACDAFGRPLALVITGGNTDDCTQFTTVMEAIRVPRIGPGRPRTRPSRVIGDKGSRTGGDAAPLLQPVEAPFHHVAPHVELLVEDRGPTTKAATAEAVADLVAPSARAPVW